MVFDRLAKRLQRATNGTYIRFRQGTDSYAELGEFPDVFLWAGLTVFAAGMIVLACTIVLGPMNSDIHTFNFGLALCLIGVIFTLTRAVPVLLESQK